MSNPQNFNQAPQILDDTTSLIFRGSGTYIIVMASVAGAWKMQIRAPGEAWVDTDTTINAKGTTNVVLAAGFEYRLSGGTSGNAYLGKSKAGVAAGGAASSGGTVAPAVLLHTFTWAGASTALTETNTAFNDYNYLIFEGRTGRATTEQVYGSFPIKRDDIGATHRLPFYARGGNDQYNDGLQLALTSAGLLTLTPNSDNDTGVMRIWGSSSPIGGGSNAWGDITGKPDFGPLATLAAPSAGSRDNMIPKYDGNVLGWEADAGTGSGGGSADGVVTGGSWDLAAETLRLVRSQGAALSIDMEGAGFRVLGGTRLPTVDDGNDKDFWVAGLENGTKLSISTKVGGDWVELGEAIDAGVDLSHLDNITQELRTSVVSSAWAEADASDADLIIVNLSGESNTLPPSGVTLTDALFNGQGPDIMTSQQTARQWIAVYARVSNDVSVENFRTVFEGVEVVYGGAWRKVTGPDESTYDYYYIIQVGLGTGPVSRVHVQEHPGGAFKTTFGGGFHGVAKTRIDGLLALAGGTMTGKLTLDGAPTDDLHAATKKYVDDNAGGGGNGGGNADGLVTLTKVGNTVTVNSATSTGPALSSITNFFKLRWQYDRSPDTDIVMWSDMRKEELATGLDLQMQGAGSAHIGIGTDSSDNIEFDNTGAGAVVNIEVEVFNVSATAVAGEGGDGTDATARAAAAAAQATADAALPKAGGTMTGALVLAAAPTANLQAATKKYVDDNASGTDATARTAAAAAQATADAALPKAGGTMTGKITLDGAPSNDLHAASKKYVDDNAGSGAANVQADWAETDDTADSYIDNKPDLTLLEEYKGVWTTLANAFAFKSGDIVEHPLAGGTLKIFYISQTDHTKGSSAPDLDTTNWHLLAPLYQGDRIDSWYHRSAITRHNGSLWLANANVVRGDPAPGGTGDTKWVPFFEVADGSITEDKLSTAVQNQLGGGAGGGGAALSLSVTGTAAGYAIADNTTSETATIDVADLSDWVVMELQYTRAQEVHMWTSIKKSRIGTGIAAGYRLQLQGAGGAFLLFYHKADDDKIYVVPAGRGDISGITITYYTPMGGGGGDAGGQLQDHNEFPDVAEHEVNDLIFVDGLRYKLVITDDTVPNLFEGTVGSTTYRDGNGNHWRGIANSEGPVHFRSNGEFTSNPSNALSAVFASDDGHLRVAMKRSVYEAAKGSAFDNADKIAFTVQEGSNTAEMDILAYFSAYTSPSNVGYLEWQANTGDTTDFDLADASSGVAVNIRFFTVDAQGDATTTPFLTHTVSAKHWLEQSNPEPVGHRAEAKADANGRRLDALDIQGTGVEPHVEYEIPDTTLTGVNFLYTHNITDVQNNDLIVVEWENFHFDGLPFEHKVGGSTNAGGIAYLYARDLTSRLYGDRVGQSTGLLRLVSDGSDNTLGSHLVINMEHSGTTLEIIGDKSVSGSAVDVPLLPPEDFLFRVKIFRGATVGQALASTLPDEIESLEDTIGQLRAFAHHQELVASELPDPTGSVAPEFVYLTNIWRPLQGFSGKQGLIPYSVGEYQRTEGDTANRAKLRLSSTVVEIGDTNHTMRGFLQRANRLGHGNSLIRDFGEALHNPVGGAMPGLYWGNDPSNPINNRASWQLWIKKALAQGGQDPWNLSVQRQAAQFLARIYHDNTHTDVLFQRTIDRTVDGIDYIRCICPSNPQPGQAWIEALNFNDADASTVEVEFRTNNGNTILWLGDDPKGWTWVDPTDNPTAVARINRLQLASKWEGNRIASISRSGPGRLESLPWVLESGVDGVTQTNSSSRTWSDFLHLDMDEFAQLDEGSDGLIIAVERGGGFVTKIFLPWSQFARAGHADYEVFAGKWVQGTKTNQKSVWAAVGCNNGDFRLRVSCEQADADSVVRVYRNN